MPKILLFAGTTEGRQAAEYLTLCHADFVVFVATDYDYHLATGVDIRRGRLDEEAMRAVFLSEKADADIIVIDATHPYAVEVSANLIRSTKAAGVDYFRLVRPSAGYNGGILCENALDAAEYLNTVSGRALLTIGSKELEEFCFIVDYKRRIYARVLPSSDVVAKCLSLGFPAGNIIAMQGPFSKELNIAMINQIDAEYIVTKDTGAAGGFDQKIDAAKICGAKVIIIGRPGEVSAGYTFDELSDILATRFNIAPSDKHNAYFPLFVPMKGKYVLIIGGGHVAERRIRTLLSFGAAIKVIAPEFTSGIKALSESASIEIITKEFDENDINGQEYIVVAATDNRDINHLIGEICRAKDIIINIADNKDESGFYFPAIVRGGGMVCGIVSESGKAHSDVRSWAIKVRKLLND